MCKSYSLKEYKQEASFISRYSAVAILAAIITIWGKYAFVPESTSTPGVHVPVHSYHTPLVLTLFYLISLPALKFIIPKNVDLKPVLKESMILYNVVQVVLNGWMVYRFIYALYKGHPFIGDTTVTDKGTAYVVWIHYCDKYLEFFDTYFMVLRGKLDQVSFLHVYHHTTIAWAWWVGVTLMPGGDSYFGALLNSFIHVLMYSYYALSLLKVPCPWKRYLTMAQLIQFVSVVIYTAFSATSWDPVTKEQYFAAAVQVWEMISLFVLFYIFFKKSYKSKANNKISMSTKAKVCATIEQDDDQCQAAVKAITNTTSDTLSKAANVALHVASKESNMIARSSL